MNVFHLTHTYHSKLKSVPVLIRWTTFHFKIRKHKQGVAFLQCVRENCLKTSFLYLTVIIFSSRLCLVLSLMKFVQFLQYPQFSHHQHLLYIVYFLTLLWLLLHFLVRSVSCSILHRPGQHLRPYRDVLVLRPGCHRPSHAEVPVVEEIPDVPAAGEHLLSVRKQLVYIRLKVRSELVLLPLQVQFLLFLLHTGYNLFTECDFPDFMNLVVFGYCVTLIVLFSNFYYQSYLNKKKQKWDARSAHQRPPEGTTCPQSAGFSHYQLPVKQSSLMGHNLSVTFYIFVFYIQC